MGKKEKEHWFTEAINKGCFETGKVLSKGSRWISGLNLQDEKKTVTGTLDSLSEKAENILESVKKSLLGIGESFKSGYTDSPRSARQTEGSTEKKAVRRSRSARPAARVTRAKTSESLPEGAAKIRRRVEDESLSSASSREISDETAEGQKGASDNSHPQSSLRPETSEVGSAANDEDLEKEIEKITEYLPDIGDANRKAL